MKNTHQDNQVFSIHNKLHHTIECAFNSCFAQTQRTVLVGGASEPLYLPAGLSYDEHICLHGVANNTENVRLSEYQNFVSSYHRVFYREDYPSSALHEIAHWCIAGENRRQLLDYGYWYAPDGRTTSQQVEFGQVEARPQAIEKFFSIALNLPFHVSMDNLTAGNQVDHLFEQAVNDAYQSYMHQGLPVRAKRFLTCLENLHAEQRVHSVSKTNGELTV